MTKKIDNGKEKTTGKEFAISTANAQELSQYDAASKKSPDSITIVSPILKK